MINWIKSDDGFWIPEYKGRLLGSRRAHRKECEGWIESATARFPLTMGAILLGGGSSLLVKLFEEKFDGRIVVIEEIPMMSDSITRNSIKLLSRTSICKVNDMESVLNDFSIRRVLMSPYIVLKTPSAIALQSKLIDRVYRVLLARNERSLKKINEIRKALKKPCLLKIGHGNTIGDFEFSEGTTFETNEWRFLGELTKR